MTVQADAAEHPPPISVVIPALNEARNLPHVLAQMPNWLHEIILVDGHSVDDTVAAARALRPDVHKEVELPGTEKFKALAVKQDGCPGSDNG